MPKKKKPLWARFILPVRINVSMSSKKSGDLEDVPSLMLSKDDVMSRPPASGGKKPKPRKKAESNSPPSGSSPLTALTLVLCLRR